MKTDNLSLYGWLAALSVAAGSRAKTRFWLSVLVDTVRTNEVLLRAGFEEPTQRS